MLRFLHHSRKMAAEKGKTLEAIISPRYLQAFCREFAPQHPPGGVIVASRVVLCGLKTEALNGCKGFRGRVLAERGRVGVYLDSGRDLLVKPENIVNDA